MTYKETNPPVEHCTKCMAELMYHHTDAPVRIYTCVSPGCPKKDMIIAAEIKNSR